VYVCTHSGLYYHLVSGFTWQHAGPAGDHPCTDMAIDTTGGAFYAAFRDIGVWADFGGGYIQVKTPIQVPITPTGTLIPNAPIRLAVSQGKIVLNYGCEIYTNNVSSLNSPDSNGTWAYKGRHCYWSQDGYDLAVAISPSNNNHFIVSGNEADLTRDGGSTWSGHLAVGQDDHQIVFWDDQHVYMATDNGPRRSFDGGSTWHEAEHNSFFTDGPPAKEFYDLGVSLADQFGRVFVGGNAQDSGAVGMAGRATGFSACGGESGLYAVAPRPTNSIHFDGGRWSTFRIYSTDEANPTVLLAGDADVRGPSYRAPVAPGDEGYDPAHGTNEEGYYPRVTCTNVNTVFPSPVAAIAVSNASTDAVLVGLDDGEVWRAVPGTQGLTYQRLLTVDPVQKVTSIYFASDSVAFVAWQTGAVGKITSPFSSGWGSSFVTAPAAGVPIVSFASRYGDATEVYAASTKGISMTVNGGSTWTDATSPLIKANVAQGMDIVDLARDLNHPYLYAATGHPGFWLAGQASNSIVWRSSTPASTSTWTTFSQGLPSGLPITGIGISPDRALYISTDGRGIWWRRDVASNVGVSQLTPDVGAAAQGVMTTFTLTWTHPIRWRDLNTLDVRLHRADGIPLWVRFTEGLTSTFSILDANGNTLGTGLGGQPGVLESATGRLDLAHSGFTGTGPNGMTVTVRFAVSLKPSATLGTYSIELIATDDFSNTQGPERAGTWTVLGPRNVFLPVIVRQGP
jgi:hypothetical protein